MYIRALRSVSIGGGVSLGENETRDVPSAVGNLLIAMGKAVAFTPPPTPAVAVQIAAVEPRAAVAAPLRSLKRSR